MLPGRRLGPLMKIALPLMKNVLKSLAKSVLVSLGLTGVASAADAEIRKKLLGSGASGSGTTTLITSNEEMREIMKKVKSPEDSDLLIKCITQAIENEQKNKEMDFLVCYYVH